MRCGSQYGKNNDSALFLVSKVGSANRNGVLTLSIISEKQLQEGTCAAGNDNKDTPRFGENEQIL